MSFIKRKWAGWNRAQRIGWTTLAVVIALVAIGAMASPSPEKETTAPPPPPPAATNPSPPPPSQSAAVSAWADDAASWGETMAETFAEFSGLLADESFNQRLLIGDTDATLQVATKLALIHQCWASFPKPLANAKAKVIARTVREACRHYTRATTLFARGVDNIDSDTINAGVAEMAAGNRVLNRATAQTRALVNSYS